MKPRNPYDYMECMRKLLYLEGLQGGEPIQGDLSVGELGVINHVDKLFDHLENSGLESTLGSNYCEQLRNMQLRLQEQIVQDANAHIILEDAERIRRVSLSIDSFLLADFRTISIYEAESTDLTRDPEALISNIDGAFERGVFDSLPKPVRENFKEAGIALAFGLPIAAVTLSFRGCEALLRAYFHISGVQGKGDALRASGPLLADLENLWNYKKRLAETLDHLKILIRIRNVTIHPRWHYSIPQADNLFRLCVDACNRMINDLVELESDIFKERRVDKKDYLPLVWNEVRKKTLSEDLEDTLFRWIRMEPEVEVVNMATD